LNLEKVGCHHLVSVVTDLFADRAWNTITPFTETFQPLLDAICQQEDSMLKYANMSALDAIKGKTLRLPYYAVKFYESKLSASNLGKNAADRICSRRAPRVA
jgi:hypothetical protein